MSWDLGGLLGYLKQLERSNDSICLLYRPLLGNREIDLQVAVMFVLSTMNRQLSLLG